MSALAKMAIVNWPSMVKGLADAKKLQLRYMRTELKRGAQRIRKHFIKEQLQGPPGIKAGPLAKGKNVWTFAKGESARELYAKIGISRVLHVHEIGLTIQPKRGELLYLRETKSGKGGGEIVAAVPQVVIPPRLKFRALVARDAPKELANVVEAGRRGIATAISTALKRSI